MFCNQCGAKLSDDAKFCSACGKPTGDPAVETVTAPVDEAQKAVKSVKKKKTAQKAKSGKKKLFGKLPLKRLLAILGGVVVLILAIGLIFNVVEEKKRTTILGNIPDPEIFFGVSGNHYYYDALCYAHSIEFETADVTKDMMDAYVDLLNSSEFPFVMDDTLDNLFSGGRIWYIFKYNGSQELYDAAPNQIKVEYNPDYEKVIVEIRNRGNFALVPFESYNSDNVSYESADPEPQSSDPSVLPDFLAHDSSGEYQLLGESRPNKAIYQAETTDAAYVAEEYVDLLKKHGYTVVADDITTYAADNDETFEWFLSHRSVDADDVLDDSPGQVRVRLNVYDTSNKSVVSVSFSEGITMENYGDEGSSPDVSTGGGYVDCPSCYSGNCTACNGRKGEYSYSPGLDREWEECWKCRGTGRCSRCGGSGQIFG